MGLIIVELAGYRKNLMPRSLNEALFFGYKHAITL